MTLDRGSQKVRVGAIHDSYLDCSFGLLVVTSDHTANQLHVCGRLYVKLPLAPLVHDYSRSCYRPNMLLCDSVELRLSVSSPHHWCGRKNRNPHKLNIIFPFSYYTFLFSDQLFQIFFSTFHIYILQLYFIYQALHKQIFSRIAPPVYPYLTLNEYRFQEKGMVHSCLGSMSAYAVCFCPPFH